MIQFRVRPLRIQNLLLYVDDPIRSIFGIARDFLSSLIIFDFREMDYWQREHYFYFVVLFRQPVFDLTTIDLDQRNKTLALRHSGTQPQSSSRKTAAVQSLYFRAMISSTVKISRSNRNLKQRQNASTSFQSRGDISSENGNPIGSYHSDSSFASFLPKSIASSGKYTHRLTNRAQFCFVVLSQRHYDF